MARPTDYDEQVHVPLVETTITDGATVPQIAAVCGVTGQTVRNWMKAHPAFFDAVMRARDLANAPVISKGYKTALEGDQKAIDRWLHNRCPDEFPGQQRVELTGADGGPVQVDVDTTRESFAGRIARLAAASQESGSDSESE